MEQEVTHFSVNTDQALSNKMLTSYWLPAKELPWNVVCRSI